MDVHRFSIVSNSMFVEFHRRISSIAQLQHKSEAQCTRHRHAFEKQIELAVQAVRHTRLPLSQHRMLEHTRHLVQDTWSTHGPIVFWQKLCWACEGGWGLRVCWVPGEKIESFLVAAFNGNPWGFFTILHLLGGAGGEKDWEFYGGRKNS